MKDLFRVDDNQLDEIMRQADEEKENAAGLLKSKLAKRKAAQEAKRKK